eukprot:Skav205994  [mRNA]  locus=scaffold2084:207733:210659:+ [translate_table: standard]
MESEIRKDRHFPRSSWMFRVYLDNFDELKKVNRSLAEAIEGKPSPLVFGLREEYLSHGVPRHPKKSVEQSRSAEVQGAIIDGIKGTASPKPDKVLRYCQLAVQLLHSASCTQKQLQVVAGGFVYLCMFRRALLGCLNHIWTAITAFEGLPPVVRLSIPHLVKMEIARFLCLVPLAFVNFRTPMLSQVTASDASEFGGGVTFSTGLTEMGVGASGCVSRGDIVEPKEVINVLTIGLFDGIAALRVAVDCLNWVSIGHVSVESNPAAARVVESQFPASEHFEDVTKVDQRVVQNWACRYGQAALVVIGAGPPCQGVSGLNSDRKGVLKDMRSGLHVHVSRIRQLVQQAFPWARVATLQESVASMDSSDLQVMSDHYGDEPFLVDAASFSLCRRPRFYWLDWEILPQEDVVLTPVYSSDRRYSLVEVTTTLDERDYLTPGWNKISQDKLPTFTTSRCSSAPGRRPAGLQKCQPHEVQRWQDDWHRFPPYQYVDQNCLKNRHGDVRVPNIQERECILGFPLGYTQQCLSKKMQGTAEHDACRYTLLGNSWSIPVVVWLLGRSSKSGKMPKRVVEARTKDEGRVVRQRLGSLRSLTVQPSTRARYDRALQRFFNFLKDHQLQLPSQKQLLDGIVSDYIEHLWSSGEGRALARDTLAALQDAQPQVKGCLQGTWRLVKTWNTTELPNRAPPMPMEVLDAMVGYALFKQQPLFALSLLIGFHGLLRTGEVLGLSKKDFSITSNSSSILISLGLTKGGQRQGALESVKVSLVDITTVVELFWQFSKADWHSTSMAHAI